MIIFLLISLVHSQKCRVLVLSGGGSHGAFEAGAISALAYNLPNNESEYNVVVGISAGAINSLGFSHFPLGEEQEAAKFLTATWRTLDNYRSIFRPWPGNWFAGLYKKSGLVDTEPERKTLTDLMQGQSFQRNITVGATCVNTGEYHTFNQSIGVEGMINATMCSSAIPAAFPMQYFQGMYYMDGAVKYHMDVISGIQKCLEMTSEENIIVDMVSCSPKTLAQENKNYRSEGVMDRADEITSYEKNVKHLEWAKNSFPKVNFRYYIKPSKKLPGEIALDFNPKSIEASIKQGYDDAKAAIDSYQAFEEALSSFEQLPILFP